MKTFYDFKNNSLPTSKEYNKNFPHDDVSYKLKDYMSDSAFNSLISSEIQKKYILQSYNMGFDSNCTILRINKIPKSNTYTFHIKVNVIFSDLGLKESYNIKGSLVIDTLNNLPKVASYTNIKTPSIGTSTTLSKLV
ncbi:hypothetical protein [Clostridium ihumii]|uniref:hypothetical protein n=1 Tax=Clostridium ihumii TaxID=1470356 RepID=UPI003D327905